MKNLKDILKNVSYFFEIYRLAHNRQLIFIGWYYTEIFFMTLGM